jgi:uncharacterized SAM-binding protein YcdF (DUF218 family)
MMFMFLIKKIVSGLLMPLPLTAILLAAGLLLTWRARRSKVGPMLSLAGFGFLLLLGYGIPGRLMVNSLEWRYPPPKSYPEHGGIGWIVVLGGGMTSDPRLPAGSQLTVGSALRVVEAVRIYRQIPGAKLLFSGGPVFNPVSEAEGMAELAASLGVSRSDMVLETRSLDTGEQARMVRAVVGTDSLWLVTSAAHMPRSMALFRQAGMNCLAAPTDFLYKRRAAFHPSSLFPDHGGIRLAEAGWHEWLGMLYNRLRGEI